CLLAHSVALLVEGVRRGRPWRCAAGGALFGLGIHVYPAVRFAPLLLPAWAVAEMRAMAPPPRAVAAAGRLAGRAASSNHSVRRGLVLFLGAALLAAAPMIWHYRRHPEHFTYPRRVLSVFSPKFDRDTLGSTLAENLGRTLLMFHVRGDLN